MKECLKCGNVHSTAGWECPRCGGVPETAYGFNCFAPELNGSGEFFLPESFEALAELEAESFWFRTRRELIMWAVGNYFSRARSFMELGCGTGFMLSKVAEEFPEFALFGSEVVAAALIFVASRVPRAELMQIDARSVPFAKHFDIIGAFDVLEHIEEDERVLGQIQKALKPGGGLLLTVPQHPRLWSWIDDYSGHLRRYTASGLHKKLLNAGFEILLSTSFVSLLLPAMLLSRLSNPWAKNDDPGAEFKRSQRSNRLLETVSFFENRLIRSGISFPLGGSRLVVARRLN